MVVCNECKTPFPVYTQLRDHFRTNHWHKFVAICLWLGPEVDKRAMLEDWWFYELRFTRQNGSGKVEVNSVGDEKHAIYA